MAKKSVIRKEMTPAELSRFFASLEVTYHSGLIPAEGFDVLRQSSHNSLFRMWLNQLYEHSVAGDPLSVSLEKAGGIPKYALTLLRIGEQSGKMEETCQSLKTYYLKRDELSHSVRAALVYPMTMVVMVLVVLQVLLVQAMPVFDQVFSQLGLQLTGLAASLLIFGQALRSATLYVIIAVVSISVILALLRFTPIGKRMFTYLYENLPVTNEISFNLSLQRFSLAMSTMLSSGLDMDVALGLVQPLIDNSKVRRKVQFVRNNIKKSMAFQTAIDKSRLFAPEEMALLAVAFRVGADAQAFDQVGRSLEANTEHRMERIVGTIEPVLVGFMCLTVGVILLSIMLPLLGVLSAI